VRINRSSNSREYASQQKEGAFGYEHAGHDRGIRARPCFKQQSLQFWSAIDVAVQIIFVEGDRLRVCPDSTWKIKALFTVWVLKRDNYTLQHGLVRWLYRHSALSECHSEVKSNDD